MVGRVLLDDERGVCKDQRTALSNSTFLVAERPQNQAIRIGTGQPQLDGGARNVSNNTQAMSSLKYPIELGTIANWDDMEIMRHPSVDTERCAEASKHQHQIVVYTDDNDSCKPMANVKRTPEPEFNPVNNSDISSAIQDLLSLFPS